jgi:prevent-host-death family protein
VTTAGLRELRQNASELVRQAEAGAVITVSVSGRAVAELGPAQRDRWRSWSDVAAVFDGPDDPDWADDREGVDQVPHNPFDS